jgi:hypothetical protein
MTEDGTGWVEGEPVSSSIPADQFLRAHQAAALVQEAELTALGYRFLSVAHGDPESPEEAEALSGLSNTFWCYSTGSHRSTRGGNDYTTYVCGPPDAQEVLEEVERLAYQLAGEVAARRRMRPWWNITWTSQPVWRTQDG